VAAVRNDQNLQHRPGLIVHFNRRTATLNCAGRTIAHLDCNQVLARFALERRETYVAFAP
jgi:hypothetical protein